MSQTVTPEEVGRRLRELRGDRKQRAVAREMGITPMALSNYERGKMLPRDEKKVVLADYYGKTVEQIFFTL